MISYKDGLEYMTRKIKEEYFKEGLYINMSKTKYLCLGEAKTDMQLEEGEKIDGCMRYNYLGIQIHQDRRDALEINTRLARAKRAVKRLNGIWWSEEITRSRTKRIYNAILKSILLYRAEAWRMTGKEKETTVEMDSLRRSGESQKEKE
ncbi:uncharacterized protein [Centruroides vittatus]|uniref:uncharacterized protein n=1 Tax=Centruroides vittatus TaxID=120091 RepID=UPI0035105188